MIVGNDLVAESAEDSIDRITDHRGADVTDVHLLGGVRRRIVNNDFLARSTLLNTRIVRSVKLGEPRGKPLAADRKIQKSRSCHFHLGKRTLVESFHYLSRSFARIKPHLLGDF